MQLGDICNYIRLSDRLSSSGQPEEKQFRLIRKAGFKVVINLAMPNSENAIPEEGNIVTAHRMTYVHIPVPFEAPGPDHLRQFFSMMEAFSGEQVWMHCALNYRVSAFMYLYQRLVKAESEDSARRVMLPNWEPDKVWRNFMHTDRQVPEF